jgi:hypothetical protein
MAINPLQPPINYAGMFPQINIGQQFAELGQVLAERQKRTQAEEVKAAYATDLQGVLDNPSMKAFNNFALKYPQQREVIKDVASRFTTEQKDAEFNIGRDVAVALENNEPDIALDILTQTVDARKNSKLPPSVYGQVQRILSNVDDPDRIKKAQAQTNFSLTLLDPEKFGKVVESLEKQKLAPSQLSEQVAKAALAVQNAANAVATATDDVAKAKAQREFEQAKAEKEAVEAKYAERTAVDKLIKSAADLGLTKAQTNSALAQTRKLGVETQKAALELEAFKASGGVDPAKAFDYEEKLRKEFQTRTKVYSELGTTYQNIKSSSEAKNGPGDIALITGFQKMLDPGSVVRETEFATGRDTAGLYQRLLNESQKLQSGQLFALDSKQRQEYVNLAKQYLESAQKKAGEDKKALGVVVKNYKLNPENVFGPEVTGGGGRGAVNPPVPGQTNVTVNY